MARSVSGERIEKVPLHDIRNEIFQHYSPITNPIKDPIKDTLVPIRTNFKANGVLLSISICSIAQWGKILVMVMGFVDTFEPCL